MVTNELCIAICFIVFWFGMACGIVIGIKAENKQRQNDRELEKMHDNFIRSDNK